MSQPTSPVPVTITTELKPNPLGLGVTTTSQTPDEEYSMGFTPYNKKSSRRITSTHEELLNSLKQYESESAKGFGTTIATHPIQPPPSFGPPADPDIARSQLNAIGIYLSQVQVAKVHLHPPYQALTIEDRLLWQKYLALDDPLVWTWEDFIQIYNDIITPVSRILTLQEAFERKLPRSLGEWKIGFGKFALKAIVASIRVELDTYVPSPEGVSKNEQFECIKTFLARFDGRTSDLINRRWKGPENDSLRNSKNPLTSFLKWILDDPVVGGYLNCITFSKVKPIATLCKKCNRIHYGQCLSNNSRFHGLVQDLPKNYADNKQACNLCGKYGHWRKNCPKFLKNSNNNSSTNNFFSMDSNNEAEENSEEVLEQDTNTDDHADVWTIDTLAEDLGEQVDASYSPEVDSSQVSDSFFAAVDSMDVTLYLGSATIKGQVDSGFKATEVEILVHPRVWDDLQKECKIKNIKIESLEKITLKGGGGSFVTPRISIKGIRLVGNKGEYRGTYRVGMCTTLPTGINFYISWWLGRWLV
jgi:hypothetical protein